MAAARKGHLTKEQELETGRAIQAAMKARERIESGSVADPVERAQLSAIIRAGEEAIARMVEANMGLVHSRARQFKNRYPHSMDYEDLVQEGMTGLMTAVYKYDPDRGNKFSTVAYHWIQQAIGRGVNKTARMVRLPENRIMDYTKMLRIEAELSGSGVTQQEIDAEIQIRLKITKEDILRIRSTAAGHASLNFRTGGEEGKGRELMDFVAEMQTDLSAEEEFAREEMSSVLDRALAELPELERDAVKCAFFGKEEAGTASEVRRKHKVSQEEFERAGADALASLNAILTRQGLTFADFTCD